MGKFILFAFMLLFVSVSSEAQFLNKNGSPKPGKAPAAQSSGLNKKTKVKKPGSARSAIKNQKAKEEKIKKDYAKSVMRSQKRTVDIQTPDVQARMQQNKKDTDARDKMKKKNVKAATKKAGKKYK
jgi:hypothetical protein